MAWSLPAVHVVLQSPVYATSGPAALSVTAAGHALRGEASSPNRFAVTTTVANLNSEATDDLRVAYRMGDGVSATVSPPEGWTVVSGDGTDVIVLSVDTELAGSASTGPCECVFESTGATVGRPVPVTVVATPGGAGVPATAVTSAPVVGGEVDSRS
ncbi:hypothetical protein Q9R29_16875 [Rothia sp. ARF10]|nr:hypothetical protein [Rothia sp. ARF10]